MRVDSVYEISENRVQWSQSLLSRDRHTIESPVIYQGVGVHSGEPCTVTLSPLNPKTHRERGVVINGAPLREWEVSDTMWSTSIRHPKNGEIKMTEHLFAALYAAGVNDVLISVKGVELPILDGSALTYLAPLRPIPTHSAFVSCQVPFERARYELPTPLSLKWRESELKSAEVNLGHSTLPLSAKLFLHIPPIERQVAELLTFDDLYERVIPAKTFGLLSDERDLRARGLIKGVSHSNTRVYDEKGQALTPLPYKSESAYHKILDLLGDLYLLECTLEGQLSIKRGGHHLHHLLIKRLRSEMNQIDDLRS